MSARHTDMPEGAPPELIRKNNLFGFLTTPGFACAWLGIQLYRLNAWLASYIARVECHFSASVGVALRLDKPDETRPDASNTDQAPDNR